MGKEPKRFSMRKLDRYVLVRRIASGGMGELFLGLSLGPSAFRKLVAVKTLHPHLAENQKFIDLFLDEARLAARLSHANIVQTFDLGEHDGTHFMAMEFVHGVSLSQLLAKGRLPMQVAMTIAIQAAAGLAFAHTAKDEQGRQLMLVHRDIAPKNILVSFAGEVKVVDFGVARANDQLHETVTGEIKGTMSYMAPEQLEGQRVDARADVYAMGVTLFELFTAKRLFRGIPRSKLFDHAIRRNLVPPSKLHKQLPAAIDLIVLRALSLEPALRHANCAELLKDLRKAAGAMGVVPAPEPVAEALAARFPQQTSRKLLTDEQLAAAEQFSKSKLGLDPASISSGATEEGAVLGAAEDGQLRLEVMGGAELEGGGVGTEDETASGPIQRGGPPGQQQVPGGDEEPVPLVQKIVRAPATGAPTSPGPTGSWSLGDQPSDSMVRGERLEPSQTATMRPSPSSWIKPIGIAMLLGVVIVAGGFWYIRSQQQPVQVFISAPRDGAAQPTRPVKAVVSAFKPPDQGSGGGAVAPTPRSLRTRRPVRPSAARPARPAPRPDASPAPVQKVRIGIRTTPSGAMVLVNGVDEGRTPMTLERKRQPGMTVNLLLQLTNHIPARRRVSLGANAQLEVTLAAKPQASPPAPKATAPKKPKPKPRRPKPDPTRVDDLK